MQKNMKLSTKLILNTIMPLAALLGLAVFIHFQVAEVDRLTRVEGQESFEMSSLSQEMQLDVVQVQQYLTDISATRGKDGLDDGLKKAEEYNALFLAGLEQCQKHFKDKNDQADLAELDKLENTFVDYYKAGKIMAKAYVDEGPESGNKLMKSFDEVADRLHTILDQFVAAKKLAGENAMQAIVHRTGQMKLFCWAVSFTLLIVSAVISWLVIVSITKPLNRVIGSLSAGAEQVASASNQVASASQQMAQGASEQASSLEETSASLEEMASMTRQNADNSVKTDTLMSETKAVVFGGVNAMKNMSATIGDIRRSAQEMAKVIKTIDEIAFQTNLLALNAAIEAARAGEAGKGFAVVAEEVRNLARRSAEAAQTTAGLIEGAQKNADSGVEATAKVAETLNNIQNSALKVAGLVAEIAAASRQQAQGIDQVNVAVSEMDKVVQTNAANAEESSSASEELSSQAQELYSLVAELTAMVSGGATSELASLQRPGHRSGPSSGGLAEKVHVALKHPAPANTSRKAFSPEKVIPLDARELKQF